MCIIAGAHLSLASMMETPARCESCSAVSASCSAICRDTSSSNSIHVGKGGVYKKASKDGLNFGLNA